MTIQDYMPLITALSAILGVIAGGLITYISNSKIKKVEINHERRKEIITEKKSEYIHFIALVNRSMLEIIGKEKIDLEIIQPLFSSLAKIEILAPKEIYIVAEEIVLILLDFYANKGEDGKLPIKRKEFVLLVKKDLEYT